MKRTKGQKARVLLVDDLPVVRQGFIWIINQEPDLMVCGEAANPEEALKLLPTARPDVVLVDLTLTSINTLQFTKVLKNRYPDLPVLIISMYEEPFYAQRALQAGASGYVMKREAPEMLIQAIKRVLKREVYLSDAMSGKFSGQGLRLPALTAFALESLSDRELQVFRLIGQGRGTRQIAEQLNLSVKTIQAYREHIKQKLSLNDGHELLQRAIESFRSEKLN